MGIYERLYAVARRGRAVMRSAYLAFPKRVECNVCGWSGRRFASDIWHKYSVCPACGAAVRHRLFAAATSHVDRFGHKRIFAGRRVLHFAPEPLLTDMIRRDTKTYVTADFLRADCDVRLDMCDMASVQDGSFDTVVAFDVLEHVPDYRRALDELRRIVAQDGVVVLTVPQRDDLSTTDEDPNVTSDEERTRRYGQFDHVRMFGADFAERVAEHRFTVTPVDEGAFDDRVRAQHVLFPPVLSPNPLATNHRKVFYCEPVASRG